MESNVRGFRARPLNLLIVFLFCFVLLKLLITTYHSSVSFGVMRETAEQFNVSRQSAEDMQKASDYLTDEVKNFLLTGDTRHVENYFNEAEHVKRRDKALAAIAGEMGEDVLAFLEDAMRCSVELMEREYKAMRLKAASLSLPESALPETLREVKLSVQELALSPEEQAKRAATIMTDDDYKNSKMQIETGVARCLDTLAAEMLAAQENGHKRFLNLLREQRAFIAALAVLSVLSMLLTSFLLLKPLNLFAKHIAQQDSLPLIGANEVRKLAQSYNSIFEKSRIREEELSYEATHDPLTVLFNRSMFEKICKSKQGRPFAVLLIDIDHFKEINDTYGHDVGDAALKRVAGQLQSHFRSRDSLCRIGGDEFLVIMSDITSEQQELITRKLKSIAEELSSPIGKTPAMSLSAGIAFGKPDESVETLYKHADTALYRVKNKGRNGFAFFENGVKKPDDTTAKTNENK